jgi:hypothetical protein
MNILSFLGPASFAQERIWLDEQLRFIPHLVDGISVSLAVYNVPLVFVTTAGSSLSVSRLRRALTLLVGKHTTLRTCLIGNSDDSTLQQYVLPFDANVVLLVHVSRVKSSVEMQAILVDEETNRSHFDLATGRVFRCHVIRRNDQKDEDLLLCILGEEREQSYAISKTLLGSST